MKRKSTAPNIHSLENSDDEVTELDDYLGHSVTETISFIEFAIINSFLHEVYRNKMEDVEVSSYGTTDTLGRIKFGGDFDITSSFWFNVKFKATDNEYVVQTLIYQDNRNELIAKLSLSAKKGVSTGDFEALFKTIKSLAFNNSEYKGKCIKVKLREGTFRGIEIIDIDTSSNELILNPTQDKYIKLFIKCLKRGGNSRYLLNGEPGTGKAQPLDAKILTPNGWVTMGEININDEVLTPEGKVTKVIGVYPQGEKDIYRISFKDGRSTEACGEHLWKVYGIPVGKERKKSWSVINTLDIKNKLENTTYNLKIPLVSKNINNNVENVDLVVSPYLMGLLSTSDDFIPEKYKNISYKQKIELLQGLMDSDGTVDKTSHLSYSTISLRLAKNIQELIWSIGGICKISKKQTSYTYKGIKTLGQLTYNLSIRYHSPKNLFLLDRKKEKVPNNYQYSKTLKNNIIKIELIGKKEAKCIMIEDDNHLYVTDNYIVTHNTECIREIGRQLVPLVTFIVPEFTTADDLASIMEACEIFDHAVIIMDDIDLYLGSRDNGSYTRLLGQFLSFFDGVKKRNISLLASTNDKGLVDKAAERPGRFNVTLDYGFLDSEQIIKVCNIHLPEKWRIKEVYDALSDRIDGKKAKITGAFIANLADNIREMSEGDDDWDVAETVSLIQESYRGFYLSQVDKNKDSIGFN